MVAAIATVAATCVVLVYIVVAYVSLLDICAPSPWGIFIHLYNKLWHKILVDGKPTRVLQVLKPRVHPLLIFLALTIAAIGFLIRAYYSETDSSYHWLSNFIIDLAPEMVGMAFTVLVLDELNHRLLERQERERIIQQMGSDNNGFALEAVRLIKDKNWHKDGSLCMRNFDYADLEGVRLQSAYLENAKFLHANLNNARLQKANLKDTILINARLEGARLHSANLQGAYLQLASLKNAYLVGANLEQALLTDANLQGAYYTKDTQWPEGFDYMKAGAILVRWCTEKKRFFPIVNQ